MRGNAIALRMVGRMVGRSSRPPPMPKIAKELSALQVQRLTAPGFHAVGVIPGLYLRVKDTGARSWTLRTVVGGDRREIGLGSFPAVTLAQARDEARKLRSTIAEGVDPVLQRQEARSALRAASAQSITFRDAAAAYVKAHAPSWRNPKHRQQWANTLEAYAHPVIGDMLVSHVTLAHVLAILEPIWHEKTETASRLRGRMEAVLDWAKGRGYRSGDNPASWKGNLDAQLARPERVAEVENHPALPVARAAAFWRRLADVEGMGAQALRLAILTAARSNEVRGACWREFDLDAALWTVPAERMKAKREHRVPLSLAAVELLRATPVLENPAGLVWPSAKGKPLSDMTLTAVTRRINEADGGGWVDPRSGREVVPHGFRSTFRDWAAELTDYPREVAEMALAHTISNAVEAAYRRGDLFEKRRRMMGDWAAFLLQPMSSPSSAG